MPLRSSNFLHLVLMALKNQWMFTLGTLLIAVSWGVQNFRIEKNNETIESIYRNLTDYWRQKERPGKTIGSFTF